MIGRCHGAIGGAAAYVAVATNALLNVGCTASSSSTAPTATTSTTTTATSDAGAASSTAAAGSFRVAGVWITAATATPLSAASAAACFSCCCCCCCCSRCCWRRTLCRCLTLRFTFNVGGGGGSGGGGGGSSGWCRWLCGRRRCDDSLALAQFNSDDDGTHTRAHAHWLTTQHIRSTHTSHTLTGALL